MNHDKVDIHRRDLMQSNTTKSAYVKKMRNEDSVKFSFNETKDSSNNGIDNDAFHSNIKDALIRLLFTSGWLLVPFRISK